MCDFLTVSSSIGSRARDTERAMPQENVKLPAPSSALHCTALPASNPGVNWLKVAIGVLFPPPHTSTLVIVS
jgi:hypothetical protein